MRSSPREVLDGNRMLMYASGTAMNDVSNAAGALAEIDIRNVLDKSAQFTPRALLVDQKKIVVTGITIAKNSRSASPP